MTRIVRLVFSLFFLITGLLFWHGTALALTDEGVKELSSQAPQFAQAEAEILSVWRELMNKMTGPAKEDLKKTQVQWIKKTRDLEAQKLIAQGQSKAEAYTMVTKNKTAELKKILAGLSDKAPTVDIETLLEFRDVEEKGR